MQIIVYILKDKHYNASYIAKETGVASIKLYNILDGYESDILTKITLKQLHKKLMKNQHIEANNDYSN